MHDVVDVLFHMNNDNYVQVEQLIHEVMLMHIDDLVEHDLLDEMVVFVEILYIDELDEIDYNQILIEL